ncbi:YggT family protein [Halobacillus yeomjeoni]|uniref:YggT family protein n=1 Tax=Halobacillus yeomjeoni TaxID=311194 RepID=A0A931HTH7_9BACI|nr:YggT family protein [Halobacillus yeomjeoni]MBH0229069.1 YggT family protein [Halobacillus yeomjeoni]MCA0983554.1 YggT family protein [Halobacillus yeomjeoni]
MLFLFEILLTAMQIYSWILIIYILMSWFPGARESRFGEVMAKLAEPFLEPFRKFIPPLGMIDISPIVAILVLRFAANGLRELAQMLL